jgi:mRNA-degrading endonuclease RelE of RelBE toxin-antitoxin system
VDDYRLICRIDAGKRAVLVVKVGHRADVYERVRCSLMHAN